MIPCDKALHIIAGVLIFAVCHFVGIAFALGAVIVAGLVKEIYDYQHPDKHTADFYDFGATLIGGLLGYACSI